MEPLASSAPFMPPIGSTQQCHILLFGDLTTSFEDDLRQLLHCKSDAPLQSFFDQVNLALRQELALLPAEEQEWAPRFTDLIDLMASIDGTAGAQALRFGLLCVYQLGRFIQYALLPFPERSIAAYQRNTHLLLAPIPTLMHQTPT